MKGRDPSGPDRRKPLIVFAGRSNVGKSSTIRALTGLKVLVGKKPGSTRWEKEIDMGPVTFVDIPGFGHMYGQSKAAIEEMKTSIIQKLEEWATQIAVAVLIIDVSLFRELTERWEKRGEIPVDIEFFTFLSEISPHVIVVANKIDKLKERMKTTEVEYLEARLQSAVPGARPDIVVTSAFKRRGTDHLRERLEASLTSQGLELPTW
jgi:GTP-binding protein EngB required for normal cell division